MPGVFGIESVVENEGPNNRASDGVFKYTARLGEAHRRGGRIKATIWLQANKGWVGTWSQWMTLVWVGNMGRFERETVPVLALQQP